MEYYLIEKQDGSFLVQGYSEQAPKLNVAGKVPSSISPDDYEFVEKQEVQGVTTIVVNTKRKDLVLAQRQADRIAREAEEKAKLKERQDLLTKLASSNAQGPLADIIRLILLENTN